MNKQRKQLRLSKNLKKENHKIIDHIAWYWVEIKIQYLLRNSFGLHIYPENKFLCYTGKLCGTAQKIKFFIKDISSKCDQIRKKLRIWSHLLEESLTKNFIFCAVRVAMYQNQKMLSSVPKSYFFSKNVYNKTWKNFKKV